MLILLSFSCQTAALRRRRPAVSIPGILPSSNQQTTPVQVSVLNRQRSLHCARKIQKKESAAYSRKRQYRHLLFHVIVCLCHTPDHHPFLPPPFWENWMIKLFDPTIHIIISACGFVKHIRRSSHKFLTLFLRFIKLYSFSFYVKVITQDMQILKTHVFLFAVPAYRYNILSIQHIFTKDMQRFGWFHLPDGCRHLWQHDVILHQAQSEAHRILVFLDFTKTKEAGTFPYIWTYIHMIP